MYFQRYGRDKERCVLSYNEHFWARGIAGLVLITAHGFFCMQDCDA